ncbi:MAG: thioredoxin-dependent thiol peroxidase [Bacteroidetes bacterium]|nr:MAG: thioredoxin-dependent thiol peroxidase [Bacteroidota bacterium]MBL1145892.1 thioredoxin-dependent thiol peroxidase [Bacteroidota bacterium]MCB0801920.1 thioredoxin-dependent thiol peroxidase [Flavobacteriales bacterium]NOG58686.1 thioredoxin-dependent thiol peroxidase [Bacteroidota bacterium]
MIKLKVGDKAPDINAKTQDGENFSLAQVSGKKLVLYFYPKDNTPGCTAQACNLKDNYKELIKRGYVVYGVSADSALKHQKFIEKYELPFDLLVDEEKKIINAYGVWGPKKFMGKEYEGINRTTFIIDETGKIEEIIEKVKTKDHTNQILKN